MKKSYKKLIGALAVVTVIFSGRVVFSEPGSSNDPLVSRSYVDEKIDGLRSYIDRKLSGINSSEPAGSSELEVVRLKGGQSIIGSSGAEIILRSGRARAIGSDLGGLSDVTGARDLKDGEGIKANHLLIVPRSDGRGVYALGETYFIVRGNYTIE